MAKAAVQAMRRYQKNATQHGHEGLGEFGTQIMFSEGPRGDQQHAGSHRKQHESAAMPAVSGEESGQTHRYHKKN
jgi:hypothetical protein